MPEGAIYVGRPTKWGNPFPERIGRQLCVSMFRELMQGFFDPGHLKHLGHTEFGEIYSAKTRWQERMTKHYGLEYAHGARTELHGKDLSCFCPLDQPCHADVLLEIANPNKGR